MSYLFKSILIILLNCLVFSLSAQVDHDHSEHDEHEHEHDHQYHDIYDINFEKEAIILGTGVIMNLIGRGVIKNQDPATIEEINALDKDDLLFIDKGAVDNYSQRAETISDIILYSSFAFPLLTYTQKHCRHEVAQIGIMGVETFLITLGITNIAKGAVKRYRPFNYNPDVPLEMKLSTNSRVSFFSGHSSTTAALSFFAAKVITDTHPEMKNKWIIWTTAATLPATVSYLRHLAGKHFMTDIITGYVVGASIGMLIPKIHTKKNLEIGVNPVGGVMLNLKF